MDPSILAAVLILWVGAMLWLFAPSLKEQPILAALPLLACILMPPLGLLLLVLAIPGRWDDYRHRAPHRR
jgi:sterol desaturase/sphingolipid hydroxylase (fatty acid hydroxylase superfamily)